MARSSRSPAARLRPGFLLLGLPVVHLLVAVDAAGEEHRLSLLDGERGGFEPLPLLVFTPSVLGWSCRGVRGARLDHIVWQPSPGAGWRPLPNPSLPIRPGVEVLDRRSGQTLVLYPNGLLDHQPRRSFLERMLHLVLLLLGLGHEE